MTEMAKAIPSPIAARARPRGLRRDFFDRQLRLFRSFKQGCLEPFPVRVVEGGTY